MVDDEKKAEVLGKLAKTLRSLKQPFFFENDTVYGPATVIDKMLGSQGQEAKLKNEMRNAHAYCDAIGFRWVQLGAVSLAVVIFAQDISNEELIGRSVIIRNSVKPFAKFDNRRHWSFPFYANVFYVFSGSDKAYSFRSAAQDKCKHRDVGILNQIHVKPWCIDFQGKHIMATKGLFSGLDKEPDEIEASLFA
jgi:hypothetical protein